MDANPDKRLIITGLSAAMQKVKPYYWERNGSDYSRNSNCGLAGIEM
ncbi:hypothetical protein INT80_14175 [Gallibacterium anatis]|uniref:Uncharacterized protein n=1 Tax=Gallibacterium anatis TaxID=750 RepID=A0A930USC3_9PAST|nr:hypothetical protein [Gallibacterium anatis]